MAIAVTPAECKMIELLFRYLRIWTPKVLTVAWEMRRAA